MTALSEMGGDMEPRVTVFTCVYNGARTMHRVFRSMLRQTYRNIEHIIVDDGSTDMDQYRGELEKYVADAPFEVKVFHKENGGKHTATNVAWDQATGEFIIKLDADDELTPNCISFLVDQWYVIPAEERAKYWCVHGRCEDQTNHQFIGDYYPENINILSLEEQKRIVPNIRGEKTGLMLKLVLDHYRYPEPKGVKFVTENIVWNQITCSYKTWYTNEVVRVYYINEGPSLAHPIRSKQTFSDNAYNKSWFLLNRKKYPLRGIKQLLAYVAKHAVSYMLGTKEFKRNNPFIINRKDAVLTFLQTMSIVPAAAMVPICKLRYKL